VPAKRASLLFTPTPARVRLYLLYSPWSDLIVHTGGLGVAGEDDSYDFGSGAGFYVNATKEPYNKGYNMYSYITEDLPKALFSSFKQLDSDRVSITGHSMGGHGALTLVCSPNSLSPCYELTQPFSVPEEPRQVQVRLRIRSHRQPQQLRLGQEGLLWLLWRRSEGEVGRARCHRAHQEVEGSIGYAHRRCTCQSGHRMEKQPTDAIL
jgi:hypothetical protein